MYKNLELPYDYLIWLDGSINLDIRKRLRSITNNLKIFEEINECEKYIQSLSIENRIILIINNEFSEKFIPKIHECKQIYLIYIYYSNHDFSHSWTKQYNKVIRLKSEQII